MFVFVVYIYIYIYIYTCIVFSLSLSLSLSLSSQIHIYIYMLRAREYNIGFTNEFRHEHYKAGSSGTQHLRCKLLRGMCMQRAVDLSCVPVGHRVSSTLKSMPARTPPLAKPRCPRDTRNTAVVATAAIAVTLSILSPSSTCHHLTPPLTTTYHHVPPPTTTYHQ